MQRIVLTAFAGALGAASFTAVLAPSHAPAAGIENPGAGMSLQSADPAKAPKGRKAPPKAKAPDTKAPAKKSEAPFRDGYRQAYDLIYRQQNYADAIVVLRGLGRDDHPDVANLIGFASRKLGRTADAKLWYETALAADPNHTRTWQYYGLWHLERGDRATAEQHLRTIAAICGSECEDYRSLKLALSGEGLVY